VSGVQTDREATGGLRERLRAVFGALVAMWHPRRSLRGKVMLVVLATAFVALAIAGVTLLLTELRESRRAWVADLVTEADILSLATAPSLAFDDPRSAARNLAALRARPSVRAAALYRPDGSLFAEYRRAGEKPIPRALPTGDMGAQVAQNRVELRHPVIQNGEILGIIYLSTEFDISRRVKAYAGVLAVVLLASLGFALLMSGWLQRVITDPMEAIAGVARGVVQHRNYGLRATKTSEDEIGIVVAAINNMLDEVQNRTYELERANAALRESERLYRAIGESIAYGVWICDAKGRNTYASPSFLHLTGITQEECSEFRWGDRLHPEDREDTITAWKACVRRGRPWYREHRILGVDGIYHPVLAQGVPIRNDHGQITGWAGINLDISRLKETESALREADRRKDEFLATLAHELRNPLSPIRNAVTILNLDSSNPRQKQWSRDVITRQVRHMALLLDDLLDVSRITRGQLQLRKDFVDLQSIVDQAVEIARPLIDAKRHSLDTRILSGNLRLEVDPLRLSQILGNLLTNAAKYTDPGGSIELSSWVEDGRLFFSVKDSGIGLAQETIYCLFRMFYQVDDTPERAEGGLGIGLGLVKGLVELHGGTVTARSEGLGRGSEFIVELPPSVITGANAAMPGQPTSNVVVYARQRKKLLVADDNRDALDTVSILLELKGYEVVRASSGGEALSAARRERPDALLLDIGLRDMTGYAVAQHVRLEAWGRRAVLIAVTGWGQEDDKQKALSAGFDEHFTKPVDPDTLEHAISRLLARSGTVEVAAQDSNKA
jgi:PAS domain S-box-containing protein